MQVILSKDAAKHFKRLPKSEKLKIEKKLLSLRDNPYSGKKLSGELNKSRSLKAWPYRIIYLINESKRTVEVSDILHRQGAYK
ncbi:MAG: type II toxin-antitoxin system RelE/ParE family toxin [Candidatus Levybacteria bacterium]|nr:type II toxin-antitoxin system RelE/ParE family toxin [Candidatus Levybacteria bacterium]